MSSLGTLFLSRLGQRRFATQGLALWLYCTSSGVAHDFWLQPNEFWLRGDAATPITLQVGHGPDRQRSPIRLNRITRFEAITPSGSSIELRGHLHPGGPTDDGELQFVDPGTYLVLVETDDRAESHLPAIRFNDYLRVEGLTPALELRIRTHRMDADGSENYSRRAKSIVQVGPIGAGSQVQVTKPVGLPLEIVPEQSPYSVPQPATLPIRVFYDGQPLAGALVKLTDLERDAVPVETHVTDPTGRASFSMPTRGSWLLNVIWTKPQTNSRDTDFETIFSSLTFGFPVVGRSVREPPQHGANIE